MSNQARRKVHIKGEVWEYYIGRRNVKIWYPSGKSQVVKSNDVVDFYLYGDEIAVVTPVDIKSYIERKCIESKV